MEIIKQLPKTELDFSDYSKMEEIRNCLEKELITLFNKEEYTVQRLEKILLDSQQTVIPLINLLLSKKAFYKVTGLQQTFPYIKECVKSNADRPFSKIDKFIDMCNFTGIIVGESDEDVCSYDEYEYLQLLWNEELQTFNSYETSIADVGFNLFKEFYDFLNYFAFGKNEITKERILKLCINQIDTILFEILWYIDDENKHSMSNSKFKEAIITLNDSVLI